MFERIGLLPKEYVLMKSLDHPNIAKIYDLAEDKDYFYIIMKKYKGDLHSLLEKEGDDSGLSSKRVLHISRQIIDAVGYCHDNKIVHRDIKLENLFWYGNEEYPTVVLADFGFATKYENDGRLLEDFPGSPAYASPELMQGIPYNGTKSDVWAIGICMYILFTGEYPFWDEDSREMFNQVTKKDPFKILKYIKHSSSESCLDLMKSMLNKNYQKRPSIQEIKEEPCYSEHDDKIQILYPHEDEDLPKGKYIEVDTIFEE